MTTRVPTFTELLDWVDGRLADDAAGEMAARVEAAGGDTAETLAWIREFRRDAALMPLVRPPAEVRDRARLAFRQLRGPWTGEALDLDDRFDSRQAPAAGVRSTGTGEVVHLSLGGDELSLDLDVVAGSAGTVEVIGTVLGAEVIGPDVAVVFTRGGSAVRTCAVDRHGSFRIDVPMDVDELWVMTPLRRARASISLGAPGGGRGQE